MHLQLDFMTLPRTTEGVEVNESDTIADVKAAIPKSDHFPKRIFYRPPGGSPIQLDDAKTISDYALNPSSALYVVIQSVDEQIIFYEETKRPSVFCVMTVDMSETIEEIKQQIFYLTPHPSPRPALGEIRLSYEDIVLDKLDDTLADYGVSSGSILRGTSDKVSLSWRNTETGASGEIRVLLDKDRPADLVKIVRKAANYEGVKLVYAGKELEGELTLSEYGIPEDSTIDVVFSGELRQPVLNHHSGAHHGSHRHAHTGNCC